MPAAGRPLSTMRRPQGFLSGRLSGVGAKEPLWLPTGDQGRLVSEPLWLPIGDQGVTCNRGAASERQFEYCDVEIYRKCDMMLLPVPDRHFE